LSPQLLDPFWPQTVNEEKTYGEISVVLLKQFELSHCHENVMRVAKQGSDGVLNVSLLQVKCWKKK
jgi:tyrosine-protein phosphatase non-receptor type 23